MKKRGISKGVESQFLDQLRLDKTALSLRHATTSILHRIWPFRSAALWSQAVLVHSANNHLCIHTRRAFPGGRSAELGRSLPRLSVSSQDLELPTLLEMEAPALCVPGGGAKITPFLQVQHSQDKTISLVHKYSVLRTAVSSPNKEPVNAPTSPLLFVVCYAAFVRSDSPPWFFSVTVSSPANSKRDRDDLSK